MMKTISAFGLKMGDDVDIGKAEQLGLQIKIIRLAQVVGLVSFLIVALGVYLFWDNPYKTIVAGLLVIIGAADYFAARIILAGLKSRQRRAS